jgi:hypothetical protein
MQHRGGEHNHGTARTFRGKSLSAAPSRALSCPLFAMTDHDSERGGRTEPRAERSATARERSGGDPWPRRDLLLLLGITIAGAALRLFRIEQWSLSAAEAATWRAATTPPAGDSVAGASSLPVCALRWLFDAGVLATQREGWLRLPFAFFGILAVPLAAAAAGRLAARSTALLTAALLALHPWHVAVSQTATTPGVALFFAMAAVALAPRETTRWWRWLGTACCLGLAVACDPFAWLLVVVVVVLLLVGFWPGVSAGASRAARCVIAAACTLLLVVSVSWTVRGPSPVDGERGVAWLFAALLRVGLPVGLCALAGLLILRPLPWRLCVAVVVPGLVLGSAAFAKPADPDALVLVLPPLLLLAASTAGRCFLLARSSSSRAPRGASAIGALVVLGLAASLATDTFLYATEQQGYRAPWREAARETLGGPGEGTDLWVAAGVGADILTCYLRPGHWSEQGRDPYPGRVVQQLDSESLGTAIDGLRTLDAAGRVMLVLRCDETARLARTAKDPLRSFELVSVLPCPLERRDETLYVYRRVAE